MAAIHNAVNSFNAGEHQNGKAHVFPQNGHRVLVEVEKPQNENAHIYLADPDRRVVITFEPHQPAITVTVDAEAAKSFQIDADEQHCFLKYACQEITSDYFSELALKEAFFKPKPIPQPKRARAGGAWS
jgi:hypothetical protein